MRRRIRTIAVRSLPIALAILLAAPPLPRAQQPPPPQQAAPALAQPQQAAPAGQPGDEDVQPFKPEELEAIVAPIALYPDPLVAQVMMAATYPLEVIQAARLMKANPKLAGDALNEELKKHDWDDSVKSLCSFPQTLDLLNEKIDWMQKLGDAFLDQRKDTMDAIQRMRAKAQAQGNLKSNEQQKVIVEAASAEPAPPQAAGQPAPPPPTEQTVIKIEPANPQVIYVPTYNPTVVYGSYPPAYPPYYPYPPAYPWGAAALSFGVGMAVGAAVWGGCNWGGGDVDIDVNKSNNFTNNVNRGDKATQIKNERGSRQSQGGKQSFNHDPSHRKGAQYRDKGTQQKYNRGSSPQASTRDRGRGDQGGAGGRQDAGGRGGGPSAGTREAGGGQRGPSASTREGGAGAGGGGREAGGMQGMGQGGQTRADSQRGQSSVSSSRASGNSAGGSRGGGSSYSGGGGGGSRGGGGGGGASRGGGGGGGGGGSRGGGRR
jgi:hypothetical protein